ncbi:MAG: S8 family serine peptidase [Deltaproteobacteria bacterium]|nr:S8 family serine peptidase [Deltaproteobacteria bacterium]
MFCRSTRLGSKCVLACVMVAVLAGDISAPVFAAEGRTAQVRLQSVVLETEGPLPVIPERLQAQGRAREVVLVRFPGPVTAEQLSALEGSTEKIYTYLPDHSFLVRLPKLQNASLSSSTQRLNAAGVVWMEPYHPYFKMSKSVKAASGNTGSPRALSSEAKGPVMLQIYPEVDLDRVRQAIEQLDISVVGERREGKFSRLRLLLSSTELVASREALARMPEVYWIDREARKVLLNDTTIWVGQTGTSGGQATRVFDQGLFGDGQVIGILDTGIDPDMCYFRDPASGLPAMNLCDGGTVVDPAHRKVLAVDFLWGTECSGGIANNEWDTQDHGTHVAGTAAGDDFASSPGHDPGDGMAPGAKLVIQDGGFASDNCADLPALGCPVVDLVPIFQQAYDQGARLHTNSWGDRENFNPHNTYTTGSEDVDEFMWNHKDFLVLFAAGNDGTSASVGSPTTAKNLVSVGATQRGTGADSMASFSSCGPTDDGRIKPDVTAPGVSIVSADNDISATSDNCGTRSLSGTSMASPAVAGLGALVRQYFVDGWYPGGSADPADAFTPSAALVKGALVNSATDMTGVSAVPDACQGWGRVLLDDALFFPGDTRHLWVHDEAAGFAGGSSGEVQSFTFTVGSGEPFKATLTWTDFPSTPAAGIHLVNDLDLEVQGPGGTYLGNVFSGGVSNTGGSADRLNNLEQVLLAAPPAGTYTVSVRSFTVPQGPQDFALVVSGDVVESPPCESTCGNGVVECTEICDGGDLGGQTCGDFACTGGGTLACNSSCEGFDLSGCLGCPVCDNDGFCELGEDCLGCPGDCVSGSTPGSVCGNGVCEAGDGEDCVSCSQDCNGRQSGNPNNRYCCGDGDGTNPVPCSDSRCSTGGVSCTDVPILPGSFCCGLGGCESGEGCGTCSLDCATGAELCSDGVDNDCDGDIDCDDLDCLSDPGCGIVGCGSGGACCATGQSCTTDSECCSNKCKGGGSNRTCR